VAAGRAGGTAHAGAQHIGSCPVRRYQGRPGTIPYSVQYLMQNMITMSEAGTHGVAHLGRDHDVIASGEIPQSAAEDLLA
jgi:hypothetical protein